MTTLAIIGGGIAGRTLAFTLAKEKKNYSRILLFQSESFAKACSWRSTAIVAPRGVSSGHSPLGDLILESFISFEKHFKEDRPEGIYPIKQFTGALTKLDQFKQRYPTGAEKKDLGILALKTQIYFTQEDAYLIDPEIYLKWLMDSAQKEMPLEIKEEFVINISENEIKTQCLKSYPVDQIVFATGAAGRFFKELSTDKKFQSSKPVQGSYLEFHSVDLGRESFSITLEGDNFIYHAHSQKVLVGSTTNDSHLEMAPLSELKEIYSRLSENLDWVFPAFEKAIVRVGLREKVSKREPYLIVENKKAFIGGLYKNGYSMGLKLAQDLVKQL